MNLYRSQAIRNLSLEFTHKPSISLVHIKNPIGIGEQESALNKRRKMKLSGRKTSPENRR